MSNPHEKVTGHIKPSWLKIRLPRGEQFAQTAEIVRRHALNTICSSGQCPNRAECWSRKTATLMILGDVCTRRCRFCATKTGTPLPVDADEPARVARSIELMGLRHAVITSVTRDDLPDGGAAHWAAVVRAVRENNPQTTIEVLIPDFSRSAVEVVLSAGPDVVGHNIETVERLTSDVRSRAKYRTSLQTLAHISSLGGRAKSGLMVGMGETHDEVLQTLDDLREVGVSIVTIGQYLQPTREHLPVVEYVEPGRFEWYKEQALARGFDFAACGPLVRSSYMAEEALASI